MSSGASTAYAKPRLVSSICNEESRDRAAPPERAAVPELLPAPGRARRTRPRRRSSRSAKGASRWAARVEGRRIAVETDQVGIGTGPQQGLRMTTETEGAVHQDRRRGGVALHEHRRQHGHDLVQHHRLVARWDGWGCHLDPSFVLHLLVPCLAERAVRPGFNPRPEVRDLAPGKVCQGTRTCGLKPRRTRRSLALPCSQPCSCSISRAGLTAPGNPRRSCRRTPTPGRWSTRSRTWRPRPPPGSWPPPPHTPCRVRRSCAGAAGW